MLISFGYFFIYPNLCLSYFLHDRLFPRIFSLESCPIELSKFSLARSDRQELEWFGRMG